MSYLVECETGRAQKLHKSLVPKSTSPPPWSNSVAFQRDIRPKHRPAGGTIPHGSPVPRDKTATGVVVKIAGEHGPSAQTDRPFVVDGRAVARRIRGSLDESDSVQVNKSGGFLHISFFYFGVG